MMQLSKFEKSIQKKILTRGEHYFEKGAVTITHIDKNTCSAEVEGTYAYEIEIAWINDRITSTSCNCPDDYNDPCKHVVATLFALREELKHPIKQPVKLKQQLEALSKNQLIQFISSLAQHDRSVMKTIQYQLNPDAYAIPQAKETILQSIHATKGRFNYIPSYMIDEALEGFYTVLDDADERVNNNELLLATRLVVLCYEQLLLLKNYDEEEQEIASVFTACKNLMSRILEKKPTKAIFDTIAHLLTTDYWRHFEVERTTLFTSLATYRQHFPTETGQLLQDILATCQGAYVKQLLLDCEYDYLLQTNSSQLLQHFFDTYKDVPSIRKKAIYYAIDQQHITEAIELTKQNILQDQAHRDLLIDWQRLLYSLYEMQDNKKEMEKLATTLLLMGEQEFYNELRFIATDWLTTQEMILAQLQQKNPELYTILLIKNQLTTRLLQYCKQTRTAIFQFFEELSDYKQEVAILYRKEILALASTATGRTHYQQIANYLIQFKEAGYTEVTDSLKQDLIHLYPRKKAFLEELHTV